MKKELKEKNIRELEDSLVKKGVPEELVPRVAAKVRAAKGTSFVVDFTTRIDEDLVRVSLFFRGPRTTGAHQLCSFGLDLGKDSGAKIQRYEFSEVTGYKVTLQEGYNLMHGRYVYKGGAWLAIGTRGEHRYATRLNTRGRPFRVEEALRESTLRHYLSITRKKDLIASLKQGNRRELTVVVMGLPTEVWAVAHPLHAEIELSDANGAIIWLKKPSSTLSHEALEGGLSEMMPKSAALKGGRATKKSK